MPIIKCQYSTPQESSNIKDKILKHIVGKKVIDIGGGVKSLVDKCVHTVVDITPSADAKQCFLGDINFPDTWIPILNYVKENGKFDFAVCTHTLEDICNPKYVCKMMEQVSLEGYIAMPSKYMEFNKYWINDGIQFPPSDYRGFIHHLWIYNIENERIVAYPKISFIETNYFDDICWREQQEICIWWEKTIDIDFVSIRCINSVEDSEFVKHQYISGLHRD